MCGKALDFETAVKVAVASTDTATCQIGPSAPPFKRTLALIDHIRKLNDSPKTDLFIRTKSDPGPESFTKLDFDGFKPIQDLIRSHREIAMTTGDKTAIAKLCHHVIWLILAKHFDDDKWGWDCDAMIQQMAKEYAFPGLKGALIEMQRLLFLDPFKRP